MESLYQNLIELAAGLPYLGVALVLSLLAIPIADKILTRGTDLRDQLVVKDNPVAGLEMGGIFLAILYVAYNAITGPSLDSFWTDVGAAALAVVISIAVLIGLRGFMGFLVGMHNDLDENGKKKDLNHEIFEQKNWAAACVSLVIVLGIVNGMTEENTLGDTPWQDGAIALLVVLLATLGVMLAYRFTHLRGKGFMDMMFIDDNPAAGVSLLGFAFAINLVLYELAAFVRAEALGVGLSLIVIATGWFVFTIVLAILRYLFMMLLSNVLVSSMWSEIFEQKNVGAGFIDAGIMIGVVFLMVGAFLG